MAQNVFDPSKIYLTPIWGHSFTDFPGSAGNVPELPGTFAADTIETDGQLTGGVTEYAVFTVLEPVNHEYPASWVGVYRLPYDAIASNPPVYIGDVPTPPEPEPDPVPDDPADPDPDTPDDPADPDTPSGDDPGDNGGDGET